MSERVHIFDTTLRDGEQSPGATMNHNEKVRLARQLERLGVDVIEAGFPAASKGDFEAVQAIARSLEKPIVAGLCRSLPADIERAWEAIKDARRPRIHTFLATSPIHMEFKLGKTPEQVLEMARAAVRTARNFTDDVEFSAEDASRSDREFLARVAEAVIEEGATVVNIPDTVGYAQPQEFGDLIRYLRENVPNADKATFSVHCHNDLGLALANTLAAIDNGARQAEVTLSGIGERAGNCALEQLVMSLNVRRDLHDFETGVDSEQIHPSCRLLSLIIGQGISAYQPIIGRNAFAHESGIHQDGMLKHRQTYEIMTPESIGRAGTDIVLGKHSGRNAIGSKLSELGFSLDEEQKQQVFDAVKTLADKKKRIYDEDMEAIVLEEVYRLKGKYRLRALSVQTGTSGGVPPTAAVVMDVDGEERKLSGFGMGPVDAIYNTICEMVGYRPTQEQFNISAITGGTDAQGEVVVRLAHNGQSAVGRGSDGDIIVACAKAYLNAFNRLGMKEERKWAQL
ncbi:2-isopropylmalate synthase [Desulfohalovibrio reitneri]|uniref:2-isopropylmalate synthase n=1 Tax=Desulfohalovibrio reitneri TaxID=1307759 RepID=UPI0004A77273|nr:2-isopropylmalate synthase [Desulfohalovibrio reitneri]